MTDAASEEHGLANAQVTGGGGHEPAPDATPAPDDGPQAPAAGSGVDLKADDLPDDDT